MAFTPDEVEHKSFLTTFRGYAKAEVEAFLRAVADDLRRTTGAAPALESPALLRELRVALEDARALRAAADADASRARAEANVEAGRIVEEARRRAADLLAAAESVRPRPATGPSSPRSDAG